MHYESETVKQRSSKTAAHRASQ